MIDPTFKREQFAGLKELNDQGRLIPEKRRSFTKKQRQAVYELFSGQCDCGCEESLDGQAWDIDHIVPIALGGKHELANWHPLIRAHHVRKTAVDVKAIAKAKRLEKREVDGPKPAKLKSAGKLQSRGFDKRMTKRLDGRVVPRK